ncbi:hypothetical protein [Gloeothece verrucosa]|uniref:Uncharacterized protein n=1 Tax=Gloeothece verrucosa (strain PCC 7822) TaxID=497965 RepID=E0U5J6_GLOV7|nr:hypothetical protein [Gloeothece verrucosa]ADN14709.1 hypothetical protein Cyan7822_2744 [Gloeothece verrucosa PCC 7822]
MLTITGLSIVNSTLITILPIFLAQQNYSSGKTEVVPEILFYIIYIIDYIIVNFLRWKIFQRCKVKKAWFAWIPILGQYAAFKAGNRKNPVLLTILLYSSPVIYIISPFMFSPSLVVQIFILAMLIFLFTLFQLLSAWINICKKLKKSDFLLLLCLIPLGNYAVLSYLAFDKKIIFWLLLAVSAEFLTTSFSVISVSAADFVVKQIILITSAQLATVGICFIFLKQNLFRSQA